MSKQNQHGMIPERLPLFAQGQPYGADDHAIPPDQALIDAMGPEARHLFNERAGIYEYDAGMTKSAAEAKAWLTTALERRELEAKRMKAERKGKA